MYDAWKALRKEAEKSPELADILSEVPETFAEIIQAAVANGFSPTHIRDMGWDAAQAKLFGHVQLGKQGLDTAVEAGTRKARTGALVRSGLADRSIEALAAATVEAAHERLTNAAVTFVEENYARPIAAGQEIPEGWVAWDPERTWVLTGHTPTRDGIQAISGTATKMVPESVKTALRDMGKQYNHWAFNGLTRGPARWWRTWMLTLSPRWYVNNIIGNTMLATTEGVRLRDWMSAWKAYRNGTLPREVVGQAINSFDDIDASTLISRNVRDTLKNEGKKRALEQAHKRLQRGNEVVDELARAAVFERHMRTGASREHAINRAYQALVDYGDLTPIERGLVRSVIPFYAWQKGVFKLLTRFPVDHPMATPVLQQIGLLHMELLEDELGGPIPDAYLGNVPITPGITLNTRPFNALMDAGSLATPEGIAQSIGPFNDIIIRDAYHAPEGPPTGYEIGPTGAAVPNVDVASEFVNTFRALPQVRLGEQVFKGEDVYGQNPGVGDAVSGFAGVPRTYTQEEVQAIIDRLLKAQSRTA
jgi:hypothetical protein